MNDLRDKLQERWKAKRYKSFNWTKILIMAGALAAILFVMSKLSTVDNIKWNEQTPRANTTQQDTAGVKP